MGFGNEGPCGSEGFHQANVFASELTGPLLVKNPRMLETIASVLLSRRGAELPSPFPGTPGHRRPIPLRSINCSCGAGHKPNSKKRASRRTPLFFIFQHTDRHISQEARCSAVSVRISLCLSTTRIDRSFAFSVSGSSVILSSWADRYTVSSCRAAGHHTAVWGEILSADIPLSAQLEQPLDLNG